MDIGSYEEHAWELAVRSSENRHVDRLLFKKKEVHIFVPHINEER